MVITDEMARYLIRAVCCLLTLAFAAGVITVGVKRLRDPFGGRIPKAVPVLYYLKAEGKLYPVVNLGTGQAPCPVTVHTAWKGEKAAIGTMITVRHFPNEPDTVVADDAAAFRTFAIVLIAAGAVLAMGAIAVLVPAVKAVLAVF